MRLLNISNLKICLILSPVLLISCNQVGSNACGGADNTGVCLAAVSIAPTYLGGNTLDVDIYQDICPPIPPGTAEVFTDHAATVTLSASLIGNAPTNVTRIRLTRYTISYTLNPGSDKPALGPPLPPFQSSNFATGQTIDIPVGGTTIIDLTLFDLQHKEDFLCNPTIGGDPDSYMCPIGGGAFGADNTPDFTNHPSYTAHYTFFGEDDYGNEVWATGATEIKIGHYLFC